MKKIKNVAIKHSGEYEYLDEKLKMYSADICPMCKSINTFDASRRYFECWDCKYTWEK
jgi:transposase